MGYLNIHNVSLSGNTFKLYLTDYGKTLLTTGGKFVDSIKKFGLSDSDINYKAFVGSGNCVPDTELSALTSNCFYDIPSSRGRVQSNTEVNYGTLSTVMVGPSCEVKDNRVFTYDLGVGTNPTQATIWANHQPPKKIEGINEPESGVFSNCWTVGSSVVNFFPTYCTACADFSGNGNIDREDFKLLINLLGSTAEEGEELIGDFNGDGKVDSEDLGYLNRCLIANGAKFFDYCLDSEIYCMLCDKLGEKSICPGDCTKCI